MKSKPVGSEDIRFWAPSAYAKLEEEYQSFCEITHDVDSLTFNDYCDLFCFYVILDGNGETQLFMTNQDERLVWQFQHLSGDPVNSDWFPMDPNMWNWGAGQPDEHHTVCKQA